MFMTCYKLINRNGERPDTQVGAAAATAAAAAPTVPSADSTEPSSAELR